MRYPCDDKYDGEPDCRPGRPAWQAWLAALDLSDVRSNTLNRQGGGPGGCEWNPSAALIVFVPSDVPGRAKVATSTDSFEPVARVGDHDVFFVPFEKWSAAARPARQSEVEDGAPWQAVSVVELRSVPAHGAAQRGLFAFARGE